MRKKAEQQKRREQDKAAKDETEVHKVKQEAYKVAVTPGKELRLRVESQRFKQMLAVALSEISTARDDAENAVLQRSAPSKICAK